MDYLIKESRFLQLMTRLLVVGILTALVISVVPFSHAAEIKELETGILFGGIHGMANETIAANSTLDDAAPSACASSRRIFPRLTSRMRFGSLS